MYVSQKSKHKTTGNKNQLYLIYRSFYLFIFFFKLNRHMCFNSSFFNVQVSPPNMAGKWLHPAGAVEPDVLVPSDSLQLDE